MPGKSGSRSRWEADVVTIASDPEVDPVAGDAFVFVVSQGRVVHIGSHEHMPGSPEESADMIAQAVAEAAEATGEFPEALVVRSPNVATRLQRNQRVQGVVVESSTELAMDAVVREVMTTVTEAARGQAERLSVRDSWMDWGLPYDMVSRLFGACADFFRAAPWNYMDDEPLTATLPGGRKWTASILGNAGEVFGLALYRSREDLEQLFYDTEYSLPFENSTDVILSLTFDPAAELPRRVVQEVRNHGWEVAGRSAYPGLVAVNLPHDRLTRTMMQDLTDVLRAVPRFVKEHQLEPTEPVMLAGQVEWTDEETGVHLSYDGPLTVGELTPWGEHATLTPSLASGPGAVPEGALVSLAQMLDGEFDALEAARQQDARALERFGEWLHSGPGRRLSDSTAARYVGHAMDFSEFLIGTQTVSLKSVSEFDLRVYLYDWYPRKMASTLTAALEMHRALKRLFEFLDRSEGITCEWAPVVLSERAIFEDRLVDFPGGFFWDAMVQDWQSELWADLENRVMFPMPVLDEETGWSQAMGIMEYALHASAQRLWLGWREELIRSGVADAAEVLERLYERQWEWARTPLKELGGATPVEVVRREQSELVR